MTTFCILDANGNVITTFANSQQPTNQAGYTEIPVDGGQVGQVWNGSAFVAGTPSAQSVFNAALAAGIAVTSTGTSALNATYSVTQEAQDNAAAVAASIGSGQGLPGGGTTFEYLDSANVPHAFTAAQFLTLADAIRNYVYQLDIQLATAQNGGTPSWPTATINIP